MESFTKQLRWEGPVEDLFAWHARDGALPRLLPPWEHITLAEKQGSIRDGDRLVMKMHKGPLSLRWEALHVDYREGEQFVDIQKRGPFAFWKHTHAFEQQQRYAVLTDQVEYKIPFGPLGRLFGKGMVRKMLEQMFRFRHQITTWDMQQHQKFQEQPRMKVVISGMSGLLGSNLAAFLRTGGHQVIPLVRHPVPSEQEGIFWDIHKQELDPAALEGVDAVIHLAGESISGLWTAKKRKAIMDSRVLGTKLLANTVARLKQPPRMFLSASGVNTYGPTGDLILTEETPIGNDFLSRVCVAWEAELKPLQEAGIRTAIMRTGVVLSAKGGALQKMLLPFKMGLGGVVGSGKQYMSWISLEDWLYAAHHLMMNEDCDGVFHLVSPQPLTNREYTKVLGRVLRRPTILPAPSFAIKTVLGEMGEALLLGSARAVPNRLEQVGFVFVSPSLEQTLRMTLGKM